MAIVDISKITNQEFDRLNEAYKLLARKLDVEQDMPTHDLIDVKPKSIDEFLYIIVSDDGSPIGYASGIASKSQTTYSGPLGKRLALGKRQYIKYDPTFDEYCNADTTQDINKLWLFIDPIRVLEKMPMYAREFIWHLKKEYPKTQIFYEPTSEKEELELKNLGFKDTGRYITEMERNYKGIVSRPRIPILCLLTP